jgi:branched-chain amino acid transport system permease protein
MTKGFISSQYADAISFSILIVILLVKPSGILGKKARVKV